MDLSEIVHGMKPKGQRLHEQANSRQNNRHESRFESETSPVSALASYRSTPIGSSSIATSSSRPRSSGPSRSWPLSNSLNCTSTPRAAGSASEMMISCNECNRNFSSIDQFRRHRAVFHVRSKTPARPREANFVCPYCGKKFTSPSKRTLHVNATHLGMKPYQCDLCSKSFGYKGDLTKHMSSHTGDKPYSCYICGTSFARNFYVKRHIETVHEKKQDGTKRPK